VIVAGAGGKKGRKGSFTQTPPMSKRRTLGGGEDVMVFFFPFLSFFLNAWTGDSMWF
jgi:hypothetical protein